MSGKWEHGLELECKSRSERRHVSALRCAVVVTFNYEELLLSGKDHAWNKVIPECRGRSVLESRDRV